MKSLKILLLCTLFCISPTTYAMDDWDGLSDLLETPEERAARAQIIEDADDFFDKVIAPQIGASSTDSRHGGAHKKAKQRKAPVDGEGSFPLSTEDFMDKFLPPISYFEGAAAAAPESAQSGKKRKSQAKAAPSKAGRKKPRRGRNQRTRKNLQTTKLLKPIYPAAPPAGIAVHAGMRASAPQASTLPSTTRRLSSGAHHLTVEDIISPAAQRTTPAATAEPAECDSIDIDPKLLKIMRANFSAEVPANMFSGLDAIQKMLACEDLHLSPHRTPLASSHGPAISFAAVQQRVSEHMKFIQRLPIPAPATHVERTRTSSIVSDVGGTSSAISSAAVSPLPSGAVPLSPGQILDAGAKRMHTDLTDTMKRAAQLSARSSARQDERVATYDHSVDQRMAAPAPKPFDIEYRWILCRRPSQIAPDCSRTTGIWPCTPIIKKIYEVTSEKIGFILRHHDHRWPVENIAAAMRIKQSIVQQILVEQGQAPLISMLNPSEGPMILSALRESFNLSYEDMADLYEDDATAIRLRIEGHPRLSASKASKIRCSIILGTPLKEIAEEEGVDISDVYALKLGHKTHAEEKRIKTTGA